MLSQVQCRPVVAASLLVGCAATLASGQFAALAGRSQGAAAAGDSATTGGTLYRSAPPLTLSLLQDDPDAVPEPIGGFWSGWDGSVAFGLTGNSGNTENLSLRGTIGAKRTSERYETTLGFLYAYSNQDSDTTENRARFDARNDWLFGEGNRWRYFISGFAEYDEFQDWDFRLGLFNGVGYDFIKSERTTLTGRAGFGVVSDFGGDDDDVRLEGLLGIDWTHQLNDRNKLYASATYYPDFTDIPEFRLEAKAGWEIKLDETNGMFLNLGIEDRYDSNPGGDSVNNDIAYFALLGWNF